MVVTLPGWSAETERSFKETLFRFLEDVNSTKAALYLLDPDGAYLLATQYGFGRREALAIRHEARSPLVLKARELRDTPLAINHRDESPELVEHLQAGSGRMLLAPIYGDSRLVGFVDARDKGRKRPFLDEDEMLGRSIAADLLKLVRLTGVVEGVELEIDSQPVEEEIVRSPQIVAATVPVGTVLDRAGLEQLYRCFSEEVSRQTEIGIAALTLADSSGVGSRVIAVDGLKSEEILPLLNHQAESLRREGFEPPTPDSWSLQTVIREDQREETASLVAGSAVLVAGDGWAILVGAVGSSESGSVPRMLQRLCRRAREISTQSGVRFSRNRLAWGLLRPSGRTFLHLEKHAVSVSRLTWLVAQTMGLSSAECEASALAGLLHDVGMVELDYENLYRMKAPGPDERRSYRNHVIEGERIVAEAGLGEIRDVVRHHHERWDGQGYPDGLAAEAIPPLSRIVHVAEVWNVLTSQDSYRHPVTRERAMETMRSEGGRQFDPRVVDALLRVV